MTRGEIRSAEFQAVQDRQRSRDGQVAVVTQARVKEPRVDWALTCKNSTGVPAADEQRGVFTRV